MENIVSGNHGLEFQSQPIVPGTHKANNFLGTHVSSMAKRKVCSERSLNSLLALALYPYMMCQIMDSNK